MNRTYKIRHIPTGKFLKVKLELEGIRVWRDKGVLEGISPEYGNVLYDKHRGWKTPPNPTNDDFKQINCEIVVYELIEIK